MPCAAQRRGRGLLWRCATTTTRPPPPPPFAGLQDGPFLSPFCCFPTSQHCAEDLAFFDAMVEKGLLARLQDVLDRPFATVTYSEAIKLLLAAKKQFEYPVAWGIDLQSEHER
eukprot:GHRQ01026695.1.p2 GENE.GHRQ01026695.1~~GHRQ01026695.1.p2  ORF type:complete len:113 (-),score=36.49 GHRQ01026695.1:138-476(-)